MLRQQLIFKEHLSDVCAGPGNPDTLDIHRQRTLLNDTADLKKEMVVLSKGQKGGAVHCGIYLRGGAL